MSKNMLKKGSKAWFCLFSVCFLASTRVLARTLLRCPSSSMRTPLYILHITRCRIQRKFHLKSQAWSSQKSSRHPFTVNYLGACSVTINTDRLIFKAQKSMVKNEPSLAILPHGFYSSGMEAFSILPWIFRSICLDVRLTQL